jgi:hypothetical protein
LNADRATFGESLLPVIMSKGSAVGKKPLNGNSWQILFFPHMAECPVGVIWKASTSLADLQSSVTNGNDKVFGGFTHLLKTRKKVVEAWLTAVNTNPAAFAVPVHSALPLWSTFPTVANPDGTNLRDVTSVAIYQEQQDRFLRCHYSEMMFRRSPPRNWADKIPRFEYKMYIQRVEDCYPLSLGALLPATRQAFVTSMFPPTVGWDHPTHTVAYRLRWMLVLKYPIPMCSLYQKRYRLRQMTQRAIQLSGWFWPIAVLLWLPI